MNRYVLSLAMTAALAPAAQAQVSLHIDIGLPVAPPMVVVQPGIQVVEGFREEVFFAKGWYWCRRPNGWYRAHGPRDRFDFVEARRVPGELARFPEGRYRNWHHEEPRGRERREERHEERDRRFEEREHHDHHDR
jgi:hypothetical protein